MEVSAVFQSECIIDENNNFDLEFKNGQEIIELFFRKNREYYLSNAIAFHKHSNFTCDAAVLNLEAIAKENLPGKKFDPPFKNQIDYSQDGLTKKYFKKYNHRLDTSKIQTYKKKYNYFNTETKRVEEFEVYNVISHMKVGFVYKSVDTSSHDLYSEINFKLTTGRRIEIKLARSANQDIRILYYLWINTTFRNENGVWYQSDNAWVVPAYNYYKIAKDGKKAKKRRILQLLKPYLNI